MAARSRPSEIRSPVPEPHSRREQILSAALGLLATTPLDRLTTRAIAGAVGVTQPALFRHFESREDLLLAVIEAARGDIERSAEPLLSSGGAPLDVCVALAEALARYVDRQPGLPRLLFADFSREEPRLRSALEQLVSVQRTIVRGLVSTAIRDGSARPDVDPRAAATLFVGMLQGLALERNLGAGGGPPLAARVVPLSRLWRAAVSAGSASREPAPPRDPERRAAAVALDVRPELARGEDPLARVLTELDGLRPGSLLVVTAPFRPGPLEALLASCGHATKVFEAPDGTSNLVCVVGGSPAIVDLRDVGPPPAPLEHVLSQCASLENGDVLIAHLPHNPRMLIPELAARGLPYAVVELTDGSALLRVDARS